MWGVAGAPNTIPPIQTHGTSPKTLRCAQLQTIFGALPLGSSGFRAGPEMARQNLSAVNQRCWDGIAGYLNTYKIQEFQRVAQEYKDAGYRRASQYSQV